MADGPDDSFVAAVKDWLNDDGSNSSQPRYAESPEGGNQMETFEGYHPILVWDDYHGFVVAKRDPLRKVWLTDLPYAWEFGGKEIEVEPVRWWPLPRVPPIRRCEKCGIEARAHICDTVGCPMTSGAQDGGSPTDTPVVAALDLSCGLCGEPAMVTNCDVPGCPVNGGAAHG